MSDLRNSISIIRNALSFIRPLTRLETNLENLIKLELVEKNADEVKKKHEEKHESLEKLNRSLDSQLAIKKGTLREEINKVNKIVNDEKTKAIKVWDGQVSQKKEELEQLQEKVNEANSIYKNLKIDKRTLEEKVAQLKSVVEKTHKTLIG